MSFAFDPVVLVLIAASLGLYARAVRVLGRRGYEVPPLQQGAWYGGVALTAAGLVSPIGTEAERLLSAHMAEHLLIADLAAPLLLVGMRSPVYAFLLPRPALVPLARARPLRRAFRFLRRPLVALPLFVVVLYGWHYTGLFEAAVRHPLVHALQHASFVTAAMLVWWPALEPKRRRMPGELWKVGYILAARGASMMLGMAFIFTRVPVYAGVYGSGTRAHGISAIHDQQLAGGMMMVLDLLIILFALTLFFWRAAADHDRAEKAQAARA